MLLEWFIITNVLKHKTKCRFNCYTTSTTSATLFKIANCNITAFQRLALINILRYSTKKNYLIMEKTIKKSSHYCVLKMCIFHTSDITWHSITYTRNSCSKEARFMWHWQEDDEISWEYPFHLLVHDLHPVFCKLADCWTPKSKTKIQCIVLHFHWKKSS